MIKYVNKSKNQPRTARKVFYLIGEFVILVVMMAGIAAAARLILQSPLVRNMFSLQSTPSGRCEGTPPQDCWLNSNRTGAIDSCIGREESVCKGLDTAYGGYCYNNNGQHIDACNWVTGNSLPTSTPTKTPNCITNGCKTVGKSCCTGSTEIPEYTCPGTNKACATGLKPTKIPVKTPTPIKITSTCPARFGTIPATRCQTCLKNMTQLQCNQNGCCGQAPTPIGGGTRTKACTWNGTSCTGTITRSDCFVDTGSRECIGPISTCNGRDPLNCQGVDYCVADPTKDCDCGGLGQAACGGGGGGNITPPPGGGPGPGGGNDTTEKYRGQPCSSDSKPICETKLVGDICTGTEICFTTGDIPGIDGNPVCKCKTDNIPPTNPPQQPTLPPNKPTIDPRIVITPGVKCSPLSENQVCKNLTIGDVCKIDTVPQTKCVHTPPNYFKDPNNLPYCSCGAPPLASGTPALTATPQATLTPSLSPTATPTPTINPAKNDWYAQGKGEICTSNIFLTYFSDKNCRDYSKLGYQTENLPSPSACNPDGIGECYKAIGDAVTKIPLSYTKSGDTTCEPYEANITPTPAIFKNPLFPDSPLKCSFDTFPAGKISGTFKVEGTNPNPYTKIGVYAKDISGGVVYVSTKDFYNKDKNPKNDYKFNQPVPFTFDFLFLEHSYEIYVRAFRKNRPIANIEIVPSVKPDGKNNCSNGICVLIPHENKTVDFVIKLPTPSKEDINKSKTNDKIEKWIEEYRQCQQKNRDDCSLVISKKFKEIQEDVGLKTEICDASLPGGCDFDPNDD